MYQSSLIVPSCVGLLFTPFTLFTRTCLFVGNHTQIDRPDQRAGVDKERDIVLGDGRVANEVHQRPKAQTGRPGPGQVRLDLAEPISECKLVGLEKRHTEKDTRKGRTKDELSQGSLL